MIAIEQCRSSKIPKVQLITMLGVAAFCNSGVVLAQYHPGTPTGPIFAQQLVEATRAKHPEADEVGISAVTSGGCRGIASTDKGDIGEKCEKEDAEPMQTGKPFIEKESDGFDVSLPLHDVSGNTIGSVGIGFKPAPGQTSASVMQAAHEIAAEMEKQIPSKASLFRHLR